MKIGFVLFDWNFTIAHFQNDLILKLQNLHQAYIHLNYDKALAKEPSHFWRDFAYSYQHSITI
tara:strand:- start:54 stop:242 length:189 start_codon:yes stop_codon:yes gene_type:complete